MQKQLIIIGVIVVGIAAIWTYRSGNEQTEEAVSTTPVPAGEQSLATDIPEDDKPLPESVDEASSSPFAVLPDNAPAPDVEIEASSQPTVASDDNQILQAEDNTAEVTTDNSPDASVDNTPVSESRTDSEPLPDIVVPSSYPASDAAKYFVPADQRRPGNLGGPPPLPFADSGSSGPTLPDGGALTPPPPPPTQ